MPSFVLNIKINWQKNCEYLNRFFEKMLCNTRNSLRTPAGVYVTCDQAFFFVCFLSQTKKEEGHMFAGQVAS